MKCRGFLPHRAEITNETLCRDAEPRAPLRASAGNLSGNNRATGSVGKETVIPDSPLGYLEAGAVLSECGCYRYRLWRTWDAEKPTAAWVMLNPSTADAHRDDQTLRKVVGFSKRWGCGSVDVVNLFACRATDPAQLERESDPVGPLWLAHFVAAVTRADRIIVAWGTARFAKQRVVEAARLLSLMTRPVLCLGTTTDGSPRHPVRLSYGTPLVPWPEVSHV